MNSTTLMHVTDSDAALQQEVVNYLNGPEFPTLLGVTIRVVDGVVTLSGEVRSYYARQVLVHACRRMTRVAEVNDELRVANRNRHENSYPTRFAE